MRNVFGHRTFTDFLVRKGVGFHPQTVILEADEIEAVNSNVERDEVLAARSRPIFDYQAIEKVFEFKDLKLATLVYVIWHHESHLAEFRVFCSTGGKTEAIGNGMHLRYTKDGFLDKEFALNNGGTEIALSPLPIPDDFLWNANIQIFGRTVYFAQKVFNQIHDKCEVEQVEFSRQAQRQTQRKTGKKPSNHYRIRNIKLNRKQYVGKTITPTIRAKSDAHLVRGHFLTHPDSHPLPQFSGKTFWIPAHTRGVGKDNKQTIYRIVA